MHRHLAFGIAFGFLVVVDGVVALSAVGCGGDDTAGTQDGGNGDATVDGTADVAIDTLMGDAPTTDGGADSAKDTGPDTAIDAGDPTGFPDKIVRTACARLESCCLLTNAQFDTNKCVRLLEMFGGYRRTFLVNGHITDAGTIGYDPVKAAQCLNDVAATACGVLTGTAQSPVENECFAAMPGQLAAGAACASDFECAQGYCKYLPDGGAEGGVATRCAPLEGQGGPCLTSFACSTRGTGDTNLYCDSDAGKCVPTLATDAGPCTLDNDCQSHACDSPTCVTKIVFSDPGVANGLCDFFTIRDAGGGG